MKKIGWSNALKWMRCLLLISAASVTCSAVAKPDPVAALHEKYKSLGEQLRQNQFKRPLVLDSTETSDRARGDIYVVLEYPFEVVKAGLNNPDHWCDVMILHINTKYCHAMVAPSGTSLRVNIGKKTQGELVDAERVDFNYSVTTTLPTYFEIMLHAKEGPLGTSDYLIQMEAVAIPKAKTFLHLTYSYTSNLAGRLALQTYLKTIGKGKVGFTVVGQQVDGQPDYVGGVRGLMERNTMRYYLAIDAFLGATSVAPALQLEKRLQDWFTSVERYQRQLHEVDREPYLEMKRAEYVRQQTVY